MLAMLGKVLRYLRLHAVLSSTIALICLGNTIQCGRPWQPSRQCGPAIVVSAVEAFAALCQELKAAIPS
jgi:hypothetical protein